MSSTSNVYILKGLDIKDTESLANSVKFVFNRLQVAAEIKIVSSLDITLNDNDYLILYLDELTSNQVVNNQKTQSFFSSSKYKNSQVLLILDEVSALNLPDYMLYLPAFELKATGLSLEGEFIDRESSKQSAIVQVVYDIVMYIKQVDSTNNDSLTIYIGPSDDNTTEEYQKIIRELLDRNHNLIPKIINPSAKEILERPDLLNTMLDEAELSIHFVSHKSIEEFPEHVSPALKVNELVSKYCSKGSTLQRIIYVPDENKETPEALRLKIIQFKSNMKMLQNAELVQTPVEKLKHIVLSKIDSVINPVVKNTTTNNETGDVYVIYAPGNEQLAKPVLKYLESKKLGYSVSQVDLDQLALLRYHQDNLKNCKGVIIVSHGNSEWLSRKLSDLLKAPGWGRTEPFKFKAVVGEFNSQLNEFDIFKDSILTIESTNESDIKNLSSVIKI